MKKTLLLSALSLVLLIGLTACKKESQPAAARLAENVKAVIHVTDTGDLVFLDAEGKPLELCVLPGPDGKVPETGNVCKGMQKDSAVTAIQSLPIIKTNSGNCITFGPDASGYFYQICW